MSIEKFQASREAAKITLDKVSSWEELNAVTLEEGEDKFNEATKKYWKDFAVSGVLQFDRETKQRVLRPFTDLDGNSALGLLQKAGIDTSNLKFIHPGESEDGAINLDTGDQFGVVYNEDTYTAWFDHHGKGDEVTSTAKVMYDTLVDLGMLEQTDTMDMVVDFVTKIDNRKFPPEEFLRSAKTLIGLQRGLTFEQLVGYFNDHKSSTEELTPEEWDKYGLKDFAERQQKTVDEAMEVLERMEQEDKVIQTAYGSVIINVNNELRVGSSAAYVRHDGIINFTPDKSFAVTFKEHDIDEQALKEKLGDKFQGKIIRGKMWIYNGEDPLKLSLDEIKDVLQ